ncbi:MAG: hypothetical protein LIP09_09715 [Bacteroidales bacterium]|nr:hypothetical protein [Bacteroidales bacterium]
MGKAKGAGKIGSEIANALGKTEEAVSAGKGLNLGIGSSVKSTVEWAGKHALRHPWLTTGGAMVGWNMMTKDESFGDAVGESLVTAGATVYEAGSKVVDKIKENNPQPQETQAPNVVVPYGPGQTPSLGSTSTDSPGIIDTITSALGIGGNGGNSFMSSIGNFFSNMFSGKLHGISYAMLGLGALMAFRGGWFGKIIGALLCFIGAIIPAKETTMAQTNSCNLSNNQQIQQQGMAYSHNNPELNYEDDERYEIQSGRGLS